MSFVAMIHNQNGLVAIADSKSTISYSDGYKEEELDRETQKIFYNDNFILLTYGKNEIDCTNGNYIRLEDGINSIIQKDISVNDFVNNLSKYIQSVQRNDINYKFNFIIGYIEEIDNMERLVSKSIYISNSGTNVTPLYIKTGLLAGGCHSQIVSSLVVGLNWSINDMKEKLNALMEISIKLEETFKTYSAVGGKINVATMDKKGNIETNFK